VVYAKTPLGGPAQVLEYLSRYTHRTAISNERIRSISQSEVAFTVRADNKGGKRLERLQGDEFVRRFMRHVLPTGVKRIRHYGVLPSACKAKKLNAARLALQMPLPKPSVLLPTHCMKTNTVYQELDRSIHISSSTIAAPQPAAATMGPPPAWYPPAETPRKKP